MRKTYYYSKKVLVTGGLGCLGSTLAQRLVKAGAKVTVLDALLPLYGGNLFNLHGIEKKVEVIIGDIRDEKLVKKAVIDKDVVFNLAAQVSYLDSMEDPLTDLDINCRGQLLLLEACRNFNPHAVVVFTGSRLEYGKIKASPVKESHPIAPHMIYGANKFAGERYHMLYHTQHGLRTVCVRIANPYGPRQQMKHSKYGIVGYFIKLAMDGKKIQIFGDGRQRRDYIYVDDVAEAILRLASTKKAVGQVFNLGSGKGTAMVDMAKAVIKVVGRGSIVHVPWPNIYSPNVDTKDCVLDIGRLKRVTGWAPKTDLRTGIKKTYQYYKKYRQHYW